MLDRHKVQGLIFDFGGTIDTNGLHWSEVFWDAYQAVPIPMSKEMFREAYVFGERTLGKNPIVKPHHSFREMLAFKIGFQVQWLCEHANLQDNEILTALTFPTMMAGKCYVRMQQIVDQARPILAALANRYPLVLVTNFYGNMEKVMNDLDLMPLFSKGIVESAVVGVRKPSPEIFRLGVERLGLSAENVAVVGDSYDKDMIPASSLGCQTIWLKGRGWNPYKGNETANAIITDFQALKDLFNL